MDAREVSLLSLYDCQRQGVWSDAILKKRLASAGLDSRDGALATQLCFGVLQNRLLLDFYLSYFSERPLKRMEGKVVEALRLGAYQMLFLDKIPHSAAVNCSAGLTRKHCKNPRAVGMVNGILRSLERNLDSLPAIPQEDAAGYLSIRYSHPEWLVKVFLSMMDSSETAKLLEANNGHPPITAMTNTTRVTVEELAEILEGEGVQTQPHPWLENALILSKTGSLEQLSAFQKGLFYIQDPASKLAVLALDPKPGMRVLDCCAAPGGKSFGAAIQMENRGEVVSCDLSPHKKKLIQDGADRLGLGSVAPMTADGKVHRVEWGNAFERVLVDAPCSGLGVIRKKPNIRYKDPASLERLPEVQRAILDNAARYVKPGGVMVYSTCTILRRENEDVAQTFLAHHPEFRAERFCLPECVGDARTGMLTLWPHRQGTDGFFISRFRREG